MEHLKRVAEKLLSILPLVKERLLRPMELLERRHLSPMQFYALALLEKRGSLRMSELAGLLQISKQQLTPLVEKLLEGELLARQAELEDRRVVRLALTGQGEAALQELRLKGRQVIAERLTRLEPSELADLEQCLDRLLQLLERMG